MSKKKDSFYFDNFVDCIRISKEAACKLKEILENYNAETIETMVRDIHEIEHRGDVKRHELSNEIVKAFITPIDRDDIISISQAVDSVTDAIEDIILDLYTWNITALRPGAVEFSELLIRCCEATEQVLLELPNYKRSTKLAEVVVEVNHMEEEGDKLYITSVHQLSAEEKDALTVVAWREIYQAFETVCDCCEDVANIVETIAIANT